jgi:hypothetical protein
MAQTGSRTAEAAVCVVWQAAGHTLRLVTKGLEALVGEEESGTSSLSQARYAREAARLGERHAQD